MSDSNREVEIIRDKWGIAHIYSEDEAALFYGAGYATAEDRMFQMTIRRRVAQGRIAQIVGPGENDRYVKMDRQHLVFGVARRAAASVERLGDHAREALEGYADGVNAYLADNKGNLNPLFAKYGGEPEAWTAADSLAIHEDLGHRFSFGWQGEAKALRAFAKAGKKWPEDIPLETQPIVDDPAEIVSAEEFQNSYPDVYERLMKVRRENPERFKTNPCESNPDQIKLSHCWCVGPRRSKTGKPILEGDPQYAVNNPPFWYEFHLCGGRYNVRGQGVAGVPAMLMFWNNRIAIAPSGLGGDDADLFMEKVNPDNPNQYEWKGEWKDFKVRKEIIRIKGGDPIEFEVRETHHGPVANDLLGDDVAEGEIFALQHTLWTYNDTVPAEAVFDAMRATDWTSFRAGMSRYAGPPLHMIYADVEGNIGHQTVTTSARRFGPRDLPRVGWTGEDEWVKMEFDELPSMFNPKAGYIQTANHMGAGSWHPYRAGSGVGEGPRAQRLRELFERDPNQKFSVRDFVEQIHQDKVNTAARDAALLGQKIAAEDGVDDPEILEALKILKDWDGRMVTSDPTYPVGRGLLYAIEKRHAVGSGMEDQVPEGWGGYCAIMKRLMPVLRETGETPKDVRFRQWVMGLLKEGYRNRRLAFNPEEDTTGWVKESAPDAFASAGEGKAPSSTTFIRHMPYQDVPDGIGAEKFGSLDPELDLDSPPLDCPVTQTVLSQEGNSYSHVVDLGDLDNSLSLLTPGVSEFPGSPHRSDQMGIWAKGELRAAPLSRKGVEAIMESSKRLEVKS